MVLFVVRTVPYRTVSECKNSIESLSEGGILIQACGLRVILYVVSYVSMQLVGPIEAEPMWMQLVSESNQNFMEWQCEYIIRWRTLEEGRVASHSESMNLLKKYMFTIVK